MTLRWIPGTDSAATTDLEENDDEAEKEERRSRTSSTSKSSASSTSSISNLSSVEIHFQIAQCLKLNAEDKINDKNAFQLRMIDFLVYSLNKYNPNLQMASACLDASGKIYGYRVDRVHSDLLKVVGGSRGEKRCHEDEGEYLYGQDADGNVINQPRKKRKRRDTFVSSAETLKGNIESYNPLSMLNHNIEIQTSDCLYQASLPKHADQGILLNVYNDVVLDRIPSNRYDSSTFLVPRVQDFSHGQLCPSYDAFQFLGWSVDDEPMNTNATDENDGELHFNMDDPVMDDDNSNDNMDNGDNEYERFDTVAQIHNQNQQLLNDFQDIISNDPNPDVIYEYSYLQENYSIHIVKPSHWKVHIKRDVRCNGVTGSPKRMKPKKEIELNFTEDSKEEAKKRFVVASKPIKLVQDTYKSWSVDHITLPNFIQYNNKRFCSYFVNDNIAGDLNLLHKVENKEEQTREDDDVDDALNLSILENGYHNNEDLILSLEQENQITDVPFMFPDSQPPSQPLQESFLGENLVSLPKLITDKIFIPHSLRAKKIDMRQLKKSIRKILENKDTKEFSQLYTVLPLVLSEVNAQSLSPGLAFTSLLHVSHEKTLILESHTNYADLTIKIQ